MLIETLKIILCYILVCIVYYCFGNITIVEINEIAKINLIH